MPSTSNSSTFEPRPVNLDERQFFAKPIALAFVRAEVDRLLVDERVIEAIEFLLVRFRSLRYTAWATGASRF